MVGLTLLSHWDAATCRQINVLNRRPGWAFPFAWVSRIGNGGIWYACMLALPLLYGLSGLGESLFLVLDGICCTLLYRWIKGVTRRPRPCDVYATLTLTVAPLDRFSFPSGHTLHAVAFTLLLSWMHPLTAIPLVAFSLLVAMSRLVLGLHYPSDVIAGAGIGAGVSLSAIGIAHVAGAIVGWGHPP